jgi:hypothetical protein
MYLIPLNILKMVKMDWPQWFMPVILATQEVEFWKMQSRRAWGINVRPYSKNT